MRRRDRSWSTIRSTYVGNCPSRSGGPFQCSNCPLGSSLGGVVLAFSPQHTAEGFERCGIALTSEADRCRLAHEAVGIVQQVDQGVHDSPIASWSKLSRHDVTHLGAGSRSAIEPKSTAPTASNATSAATASAPVTAGCSSVASGVKASMRRSRSSPLKRARPCDNTQIAARSAVLVAIPEIIDHRIHRRSQAPSQAIPP